MKISVTVPRQLRIQSKFAVQFISILVAAHGILILANTLLDELAIRRSTNVTPVILEVPLLIGVSLIYLSTLLRRRKHTAWLVTVAAYTFYLGINLSRLVGKVEQHTFDELDIIKLLLVPTVVIGFLAIFRYQFVVRSDFRGFRAALRFSIFMILVALAYGVIGFQLLDTKDFHQEISIPTSLHYTIDQFNITTTHPLELSTRRAHIFADSLSLVSLSAVVYVIVSLFQPLRIRFSDQARGREHMKQLLVEYGAKSEDFFKLWPHDKHYFFEYEGKSGLAFHVWRGVALCLGDPVGDKGSLRRLTEEFSTVCYVNDWLPAYVHIEDSHRKLYESNGFLLQKIGQEAVVGIEDFIIKVSSNKYFRHINNKFVKQDFSCELLLPPHHAAVLNRLSVVSKEWLGQGGRDERGFVMGYFTEDYMQQCPIMVVRDAAGTIQAFLNQLPATFDTKEATYDLLRHTKESIGNINDFLLLNFIFKLQESGYERLNLGLCPLVGLDDQLSSDKETNKLIGGVLRFAYANGDRFYSFSGLHRFKSKYEPEWRDRYLAYQGGVRGFSRTLTALMRTMRVK